MAKKEPTKRQKRTRNFLVNIGAAFLVENPDPALAQFTQLFQESAALAILSNLCKFCGAKMTKAAKTYIENNIVEEIIRHPNFDVKNNKELRGAFGVPVRKAKLNQLRKFFMKALVLEVRACSGNARELIKETKAQLRQGQAGGKAQRKAIVTGLAGAVSQEKLLNVQLKNITEQAYRLTSFKTKEGTRNWLIEANTGETEFDIGGYEVFPPKGQTIQQFERRKERKKKRENQKRGSLKQGYYARIAGIKKYSRTGTHIMIRGDGGYDPNDWRPNPGENNVISKTFMKGMNGILKAIKKAAVDCLRQRKRSIKKDIVASINSQKPIEIEIKAEPTAPKAKIAREKAGASMASLESAAGARVQNAGLDTAVEAENAKYINELKELALSEEEGAFESAIEDLAEKPLRERRITREAAQIRITNFRLAAQQFRAKGKSIEEIIDLLAKVR